MELCMVSTLNPSEEAQLAQTVEMFEVITQSQPQDYQSLEILKEAYSKLGREKDVVGTSKRIAWAMRLSSALPNASPRRMCRWASFPPPFSNMKRSSSVTRRTPKSRRR